MSEMWWRGLNSFTIATDKYAETKDIKTCASAAPDVDICRTSAIPYEYIDDVLDSPEPRTQLPPNPKRLNRL